VSASYPEAVVLEKPSEFACAHAVLTGVGFVSSMLGLVIALPLLEYATYHPCRDLVR
jgi:uncharacterized membrane protein